MRGAYLSKRTSGSGCRGGVGSNDGDYALEIGMQCNVDIKMMALCCLVDELWEYLQISPSPIGQMLLDQWKQEITRLEDRLK